MLLIKDKVTTAVEHAALEGLQSESSTLSSDSSPSDNKHKEETNCNMYLKDIDERLRKINVNKSILLVRINQFVI